MTSNEAAIDEQLSMFLDDKFEPSNFVDKLVFNVTHDRAGVSPYSKNKLSSLTHTINQMITQLDYSVHDITNNELKENLAMLENSNSAVGFLYGEEDHQQDEVQQDSTRLQYYLNILNNSIHTLSSEIGEVNKQLNSAEEKTALNDGAIDTLIQLKKIKTHLLEVIQVFEHLTNSLSPKQTEKTNFTYSVDEFQLVLDNHVETVRSQLAISSGSKDYILQHIHTLMEMQGVFTNMVHFNPIFKKFISRLSDEKESYLARTRT
ncbi:uncharacterized protein LODBEIA_P22510 [Lodderomyces beijingensis]|uniref:Uncharacterized protein n=1 Tax=Lodderomyces beijingensis TaxID=1775926 RepID=A0ABP0ZPE2_9ASCO